MLYESKWMDSLVYLKIFCFAGIFQPLISIIANLLNVKGKSEYTFYALVFNLLLTIPVIYIGFVFGLIELSYGILIVTILYYLLMGSLVSSQSSLSFTSQIKMILKTILLPFSCYLLTYLLIYLLIYLFIYSLIIL